MNPEEKRAIASESTTPQPDEFTQPSEPFVQPQTNQPQEAEIPFFNQENQPKAPVQNNPSRDMGDTMRERYPEANKRTQEKQPVYHPPQEEFASIEEAPSANKGIMGKMEGMGSVIVPLVLAIMVSWGMVNFMAAPKQAYQQDINRLELDMVDMRGEIATNENTIDLLTGRLNTVESNESNYASTASLASYATTASVAALSGLPATIDTRISTLSSNLEQSIKQSVKQSVDIDISKQSALITAMEARIKTLEDTTVTTTGSSVSGEDAVDVDMGYSQYFYWTSGNATVVDQSLSMMITNNLATTIKGVEIEIVIVTRGIPLNLQNDLCAVVGGYPLQFNKIHVGNGIIVIRGTTPAYGEGLEIESGDSEYVYFTVNLGVPAGSEPASNITMYVDGSCKDYDITN